MRSVVHDFRERLEFSARLSDEADWIDFYRGPWPDMEACVRLDGDSKWQRSGVDRVIFLPNGKQIYIDEKKREKDYGDFLLEIWSVWLGPKNSRNKIGWTLDEKKQCDYVAYAVLPAAKCHLLPNELLRIACRRRLREWKKMPDAYPKDAPNRGYMTRNCAVPWNVLYSALRQEMERGFGSELVLPQIRDEDGQLVFEWN